VCKAERDAIVKENSEQYFKFYEYIIEKWHKLIPKIKKNQNTYLDENTNQE